MQCCWQLGSNSMHSEWRSGCPLVGRYVQNIMDIAENVNNESHTSNGLWNGCDNSEYVIPMHRYQISGLFQDCFPRRRMQLNKQSILCSSRYDLILNEERFGWCWIIYCNFAVCSFTQYVCIVSLSVSSLNNAIIRYNKLTFHIFPSLNHPYTIHASSKCNAFWRRLQTFYFVKAPIVYLLNGVCINKCWFKLSITTIVFNVATFLLKST